VKWAGYPPVEASWQDAKDVANAPETVQNFHETNPKKPTKDT